FRRISQQVLEYLHVPHDLPLAPQHQLLLAAKSKEKDLEEGTPDHPGELLETAEVNGDGGVQSGSVEASAVAGRSARATQTNATQASAIHTQIVQAAVREAEPVALAAGGSSGQSAEAKVPRAADAVPVTGTVVLNVEQGGIEVPSFVGKTVRNAGEAAQDAGLELAAVGSGAARQQSPPAVTHG